MKYMSEFLKFPKINTKKEKKRKKKSTDTVKSSFHGAIVPPGFVI